MWKLAFESPEEPSSTKRTRVYRPRLNYSFVRKASSWGIMFASMKAFYLVKQAPSHLHPSHRVQRTFEDVLEHLRHLFLWLVEQARPSFLAAA